MNIEEIKRIVALMSANKISEFNIESEDIKLCIKREKEVLVSPQIVGMQAQAPVQFAPPVEQTLSKADKTLAETAPELTIDAPIVGTFYLASSPESPAFVKVGDSVSPDTVVCIVEAMKVMNEIKAETSGVIKKILLENASPVEYGQPMFVLS